MTKTNSGILPKRNCITINTTTTTTTTTIIIIMGKSNGKITKTGKRNRTQLMKECGTLSVACLVSYMGADLRMTNNLLVVFTGASVKLA